ncbi:MAG: 2-amino-4-hydroxy-6-hydroxymethyldihydropteridine diphosphokinase [Nitriliruptoraceae bacterium]
MAGPVTAFLGLGANVGDTLATLTAALGRIGGLPDVSLVDVSGVYRTPPWPGPDDPRAVTQQDFHNLVVRIETTRSPEELLDDVQRIEAEFGRDRDRETRWGPRPLDVDVLLYADVACDTPRLTLPHPRLAERAFVLIPLLEVYPGGQLPDGRRIVRLAMEADATGIELDVRLAGLPGRIERPEGPAGPGASFGRPDVDDVAQQHGRGRGTDATL